MQKTLFFLLFSAFASHAAAQQVLYSENFNTGIMPTNITLIDADGLAHNPSVLYIDAAWKVTGGTRFATELDSFAVSTSYNEPNGTPLGAANDWLITPPILLGANGVVKWNAKSFDASYPDGYEVRIGTAATLAAMANSTLVYTSAAESGSWTARQASLSAFAEQTVCIAFRNNTNEGYLLGIDDIVVEASLPVSTQAKSVVCQAVISPNPSQNAAKLYLSLQYAQNVRVELTNLQGQLVFSDKYNMVSDGIFEMDALAAQPNGVYFLKIFTDDKTPTVLSIVHTH